MQKRHETVLLLFWGLFNVYALRVNLSVAAVHMQTQYNWSDSMKGGSCLVCCVFGLGRLRLAVQRSSGLRDLSASAVIGTILGAFFYGYILTQVVRSDLISLHVQRSDPQKVLTGLRHNVMLFR